MLERVDSYTSRQFFNAVNLAAFLGCASILIRLTIESGNPAFLFIGPLFGVPISLLFCWIFGAPILRILMRKPISWVSAALWGGLIATFGNSIYTGLNLYAGWRQSLDPNIGSQFGGGDYIQSIDGILTPYGWQVLAFRFAVFALHGVAIGVCVRWYIGSGNVAD